MKKLVALLIVAFAFATAPACADHEEGGFVYDKGENDLRKWQALAVLGGGADAQYNLGMIYYNRNSVPQDYKQAVKWWKLSAKQGDARAQNSLGVMYNNGLGVLQDYKESLKLYILSAEQGYAPAQGNLGLRYYSGDGVPQDYVRAHMWFNLAASNGNKDAPENRNIVAKIMTSAQLEKAQNLARECIAKDYKGC